MEVVSWARLTAELGVRYTPVVAWTDQPALEAAARSAVSDARALRAHVVLTTYGFSRRGISLPDMTALVLASPRRHGNTQTLGRILRRGSDESILRVVVDIVDVCTGLRGQAAERRRAYAAKQYPVTKIACSYADFAAAEPPGGAPPAVDELAALPVEELIARTAQMAPPVDKHPVDAQPVDKHPVDAQPVDKHPVDEHPVDELVTDVVVGALPRARPTTARPTTARPKTARPTTARSKTARPVNAPR